MKAMCINCKYVHRIYGAKSKVSVFARCEFRKSEPGNFVTIHYVRECDKFKQREEK